MKATIFSGIQLQVGINIKKIRLEKELNVKKVCDDLELSPAAYSNIERGVTDISISRIIQLAQYFNVHLSALLEINDLSNCNFQHSTVPKETAETKAVVTHLLEEINFLRAQNDFLLKRGNNKMQEGC
jgi:transcriptional regulator with XRE-family HTH domain